MPSRKTDDMAPKKKSRKTPQKKTGFTGRQGGVGVDDTPFSAAVQGGWSEASTPSTHCSSPSDTSSSSCDSGGS